MIDLAVLGSGPAGLTAALYAARAGLSVTVFEKSTFGGALAQIPNIQNFPGYTGPGADLAAKMQRQAESAGAKFEYLDEPLTQLKNPSDLGARAVLVATGSEPIPLSFTPDKPVSYCALCDAPLYKGKNILVVGGGNSAVSESIHLAEIVGSLTLVSHSPLKADAALISKLKALKNITIKENLEVTPDLANSFDGIFVFIGKRPAATFLASSLLDAQGYITTDTNHMTSTPGIFAAGDVRSGATRQTIAASADGAMAAIAIANYLK